MVSPRLEIQHLSKTFGSTQVLSDVHLSVAPGEIHALVGQNGSGKSTIIKILGGFHAPDRGAEIRIDGEVIHLPVKARDLRARGVGIVHQTLGLVEHLSAAENISIGQDESTKWSRKLDRRKEAIFAREVLTRLRVAIDLSANVQALAPEERASVAIARAMRSQVEGKGLIVLDESTRGLSRTSANSLYSTLRHAARSGSSVIVVAHSLAEVMAVSDRVTILRDGKVVGDALSTQELSEQMIAGLMLGRTVDRVARPFPLNGAGRPRVAVSDLATGHAQTLGFHVMRGEILGLTGTPGSGYEQVPYLLSGASQASRGVVTIDNVATDLARSSIRSLLGAGVMLVPERRESQGLAFDLSVTENLSLPRIHTRGHRWFRSHGWQRHEAKRIIADFGVQPPDPAFAVGKLSGGNQQKVLLGKWIYNKPALLVLHEPTQGVDVSARRDLLNAVVAGAQSGTSVLFVSTDTIDMASVCHRVLVVEGGTIATELVDADSDEIVAAIYGGAVGAIGRRAS